MAYNFIDETAGMQRIEEVSSDQRHPFGTRAFATDPTYGIGEFVYVKGVGSAIAHNLVTYDTVTGATVLTTTTTRGPVAILKSLLNATTLFGWAQISGKCPIKSGTVASGAIVYGTATGGQVDDVAVVAGALVEGAILRSADGTPAAGFALVQLNYPNQGGLG